MPRHYISHCRFAYLLLLRINTQKQPDKKKSNAIVKYRAGNGISPALRKLSLLISAISTYEKNVQRLFNLLIVLQMISPWNPRAMVSCYYRNFDNCENRDCTGPLLLRWRHTRRDLCCTTSRPWASSPSSSVIWGESTRCCPTQVSGHCCEERLSRALCRKICI